ncbi:MAG: septal ring lytic transglycosylase RlpA family lipoprotein [Legionella sp.]|nr:MAG: septal ring lytic transglycosylase RlpA family lipoprotein [Legionella sp.]PJD99909.1 MAG: septal ring lytic transglycosylase RlpA family lipoprotein [Legionella sp.]
MKLTIKTIQYLIILALLLSLNACTTTKVEKGGSYKVKGKTYTLLKSAKGYKAKGTASFYGKRFHNRKTSNGERYNMYSMTAAHPTLPFNTRLQVKNIKNGKTVVVRVNDRGPFYSARIIDLSYAAANRLGISSTSTVEIKALG